MTQTVPRRRFDAVLEQTADPATYLREHPHPALLLEPYGKGTAETVRTPVPGAGDEMATTISDRIVAQSTFTFAGNVIHPDARVLWLEKSARNPFAGMITLGRAKNNDLVLSHAAISKMHAIFYAAGEGWLIEDRGSTNGTFLDGVQLPPNQRRSVNDGGSLRFADAVVVRFFEPESFVAFCSLMRGSQS